MRAPARLTFAVFLAMIAAWMIWRGIMTLATVEEIPWRDPRYSARVGSVVMLITSSVAVVGAYYLVRTLRIPERASTRDARPSRGRIALYLMYAGIPGAACAAVLILIFGQIIDLNETVYLWLSFSFGPPGMLGILISRAFGETKIFQWLCIVIVSLGYFWAIGMPVGKIFGLLPSHASRSTLWIVQGALVVLHLLWGYGFLLLLKA